jgi:DNA helicase-2/ATP-dependent DNA helicase PcrA
MKERLSKMVEEVDNIWISTFHSMCVKILRRHISSLKSAKNPMHQVNFDSNFSIYTDTEKDKALKTVIAQLGITKDGFAQKASYHISNAKNNNLSSGELLTNLTKAAKTNMSVAVATDNTLSVLEKHGITINNEIVIKVLEVSSYQVWKAMEQEDK